MEYGYRADTSDVEWPSPNNKTGVNRESDANPTKDIESIKVHELKPVQSIPWEYAFRIDTSDVEWTKPNDKKEVK